ncbi:aminotransferase class I/II-fold pyridoxal phosphate-dependent enzyme [Flaviflexus salsibiostraticola]|uniref:cysteine-S-conjugate beta-lyase n=1 Tax=Flaviflexus salsibiostraticola TaxID=1282737 RepID=A0A3Q8WUU0_9ACTO|nr:aminotransferase class I/II-fold pyridoxal phosphate-dependent enzyme [Flaviflexus salsibiostraticola]AZN29605.1 aminotransferase class I/II-fold pyridoxal phosphate-dependent enzyme [Flaviflexus salsibiostraticola]
MFDSITPETLRAAGSVKWTAFPDTIGMFVAEMDFGVPPVVSECLRARADSGAMGYLPTHVAEDLREATAEYMASSFGWAVEPSSVYLFPDVLAVLRETLRRLVPEGPIVVPTPAYMPFLTLPAEEGRDLIEVPSRVEGGRWVLDYDGIDRALSGGGLFVLCNPWNPVGRVLERDELTAIEEIVARNGATVFSDEIHAPHVFDGTHIPYASLSDRAARHTITATSTSKGWNTPGLKCAQMIVEGPFREAIAAPAGLVERQINTIGVEAATAVYRDSGDWLQAVKAELDQRRRRVTDVINTIPGLSTVTPEGTYIAWIDASDLADRVESPVRLFRDHGVSLTDGAQCGEGYENHLRLIFGTTGPILEEALARMAAAVAGLD